MRRQITIAALAGLAIAGAGTARADDDFGGATVIFARGPALYRVDARGNDEVEIARLPAGTTPRSLHSDGRGQVLLVDLAGTWAWMRLDGSARSLTPLPCGGGPAQLSADGRSVLCRSARAEHQTIIVGLDAGTASAAIDVPPGSARLAGTGVEQRLVWADVRGVWSSPPLEPRQRTRVAPDPPLRGFLPSPDGTRGIGIYGDQVFNGVRTTQPAEVLMTVQLDGRGARRKAFPNGVAVAWSHDAQWVLVQDGASACIMRAAGGQYKCWKGYTAVSVASDGRWALVLGNRDGSKQRTRDKRAVAPERSQRARPARPARTPADPDAKPWDYLEEPSDEPEAGEAPPASDEINLAPPSGPQALYRVRLEGAFTERPSLIVKIVDGPAVWVPGAR